MPSGSLTYNAREIPRSVVRPLDEAGEPIDESGPAHARPLEGDVLAGESCWTRPVDHLRGRPVRPVSRPRDAALFGFDFAS
jgi:hypothetical protein